MSAEPQAEPLFVSPADVEGWLRVGAAALGVLGILGAPLLRWRTRRLARRAADLELREAMLEVARRSADIVRWDLIQTYGKPGDRGFIPDSVQRSRRAAVLQDDIEDARRRLWSAMGFPHPETTDGQALSSDEKQVLLRLRQTMRLQASAMEPGERAAFIAEQQQQPEDK